MKEIPLPSKFEVKEIDHKSATFIMSPFYPGYGTTLGNALRRVLLSSLEGAAVKAVKINGVQHEFSTIDYVKEDVVGIILNLKTLRFQLLGEEDVHLKLKTSGEKTVTVGDIDPDGQVEFIDKDQVIATLTDKKGSLEMDITIGRGRGYDPVESREKDQLPLGTIAVDAIYTPVRRVNFRTENVRVEQMTNYEKCFLDIETDGTIAPRDAFTKAVQILMAQFQWLEQNTTGNTPAESTEETPEPSDESPQEPLDEPKKAEEAS